MIVAGEDMRSQADYRNALGQVGFRFRGVAVLAYHVVMPVVAGSYASKEIAGFELRSEYRGIDIEHEIEVGVQVSNEWFFAHGQLQPAGAAPLPATKAG